MFSFQNEFLTVCMMNMEEVRNNEMFDKIVKPDNPFTEPNEKLGFSRVLDKYSMYVKNGTDSFTDFLDPRSIGIFLSVLKKHRIEPIIYGGYASSERNMMGFCDVIPSDGKKIPFRRDLSLLPTENTNKNSEDVFRREYMYDKNCHLGTSSWHPQHIDSENDSHCKYTNFPITPVSVVHDERFSSPPTHRDYLGSIIGLGLDRGKLGDICLDKNGAIVYAHSSAASFIVENLRKVGKTFVKTAICIKCHEPAASGKTRRITVASLRLDAFVAAAFKIPRTKATELFERQKVFVNFRSEKKTHILSVYDKITVRGHGRVEIESVEGFSKKDKIALIITNK